VNFEVSSCKKIQIFRGFAPYNTGGAYSAPPDPLLAEPLPKNLTPLSALRALRFCPMGLKLRRFGPKLHIPPWLPVREKKFAPSK